MTKVYCKNCRYLYDIDENGDATIARCQHPTNGSQKEIIKKSDTWYQPYIAKRYIYKTLPMGKNENNNCPDYKRENK